jgi:nicotinate (nicotinamide) nucleotide adenylyltransferase
MKFKHKTANLQALNFMHGLPLRVGVLGGTFDPAHAGHLIISEQALDFYHFDFVIWLVANQNPTKPPMQRDIFIRAENALKVAIHPKIIVSTAEYDLNSFYSYDAILLLLQRYKTVKFTWLMGMDLANSFRNWYRRADLIKLCDILIFDRPCNTRLINAATIGLKPKANLAKTENNNIMVHRGKLCDLSSTQLRN